MVWSNSIEASPATTSSDHHIHPLRFDPWTPSNPFSREKSVGKSKIDWDWLNYQHKSFIDVPYTPNSARPCLWLRGCNDIGGGKDWLLRSDIVREAMSQAGSIKLQLILAQMDDKNTNMIFQKTFTALQVIMTSEYGRYFFLTLIDSCDLSHLELITAKLTFSVSNLTVLSCHQYGSQCLKKLIKVLEKSKFAFRFTSALAFRVYTLMTDRTGSNIIQECLEVFSYQQNAAIYIELVHCCIDLAIHERGCVSLNRAIRHIKGTIGMVLVYKICDHAVPLAYHPYGHFVIQFVLGMQNYDFSEAICQNLKGHYEALSTRKEGSHVVEKCLESEAWSFALHELLWSNKLGDIASDGCGNHVIQTAIRETKKNCDPTYQALVRRIVPVKGLGRGHGANVL